MTQWQLQLQVFLAAPLLLKPWCSLPSLASLHHARRLHQESSPTTEGMRLQQVEERNLISNQGKQFLTAKKPHWVSTFYAEAGFRLRMKTQSLSYHGKYFKNHLQKVWLEIGTAKQCSTAPRGKFLQFSGCFPWLIWLQQKVPGKEQGNQNSPSRGFGHAWCLGGVLLGLIGWFLFGVVLDFWKKIKDGAGSCMGRGTEGSPGHTCSSYGDKRIVWEVGLLLWVPLETALAAEYCSFVRLPLPRILDYLWLSEFLSHKVDFLSAPERTTGSLTALSCLWKEARIQSAHNKSSRKIPQFLLDVLPSK